MLSPADAAIVAAVLAVILPIVPAIAAVILPVVATIASPVDPVSDDNGTSHGGGGPAPAAIS